MLTFFFQRLIKAMKIMIKYGVIIAVLLQATRQEGCSLNLFRLWDVLGLKVNTYEILYPPMTNDPNDRNITLSIGETIILSCNGGHFSGINTTLMTLPVTCNQDSQFEVQDTIVKFDKVRCVSFATVSTKTINTSCGPNAVEIEVGFQIGLNIKYLPQIIICFDVKNHVPLYTNHSLTKSISFTEGALSASFVTDTVFNVSIDFDKLYNFEHQQTTINNLLGLPVNSTKYIDPRSCNPSVDLFTPGYCFSRRPLTAVGNFVYIPQQTAAYRYINVVPQWYFLDFYNLNDLELNVVDFVRTNKIDLEVYTGTYGIATLPHDDTGEDVELFLYVSENVKVMPVPLLFWKLIYEPLGQTATVFLVVNDPYHGNTTKNVICEDISDDITWLTWDKSNVTKGYSYACTYEDVKTTITYLPEIEVKGTLGTVKKRKQCKEIIQNKCGV